MSNAYSPMTRHSLGRGTEAMYVADEVDHVQWMIMADFRDEEPHTADCEECAEDHRWRKVYVRV